MGQDVKDFSKNSLAIGVVAGVTVLILFGLGMMGMTFQINRARAQGRGW